MNISVKKKILGSVLVAGLSAFQSMAKDDFCIIGGEKTQIRNSGSRMLMIFAEDGEFTVTGAGTVELLMVGGGGGGGEDSIRESVNQGGAGGGAGGVIYRESFAVTAGKYTVQIGKGGEIWNRANNAEAMGGNTTLSKSDAVLLTAFGGGYGACNGNPGADGGCGGGGAKSYWSINNTSNKQEGGKAIHAADGNLGFDGGVSTHSYGPGGGGGAGGPAQSGKNSAGEDWDVLPGVGGIGFACSITGSEVYYAGGGGGWNRGNVGKGGIGGGGDGHATGTDGLGGGGGANAKGGSGVLIIRYLRRLKGVTLRFQ
jgi:hypothetical protein